MDIQRAAVKSSELNIHLISQEYGITTLDIIIHNKKGPSKKKLNTLSGEGGGVALVCDLLLNWRYDFYFLLHITLGI